MLIPFFNEYAWFSHIIEKLNLNNAQVTFEVLYISLVYKLYRPLRFLIMATDTPWLLNQWNTNGVFSKVTQFC